MLAFVLAALGTAPLLLPPEPGLEETQRAAAQVAAGAAADDRSRETRARRAHWAPVLRGQLGLKQDQRARRGVFRNAPLLEDDTGDGRLWGVTVQWDLAQLVFAREETQLALAHAHLARLRADAATRAGKLWVERRQKQAALPAARLEVLALTAELDALTGGLFQDALAREEAACAPATLSTPQRGTP